MHIPFFFSQPCYFVVFFTSSSLHLHSDHFSSLLFLCSHLLSAPVITIGSYLDMRFAISRERTSKNGRRKRGKIGHQNIQKV